MRVISGFNSIGCQPLSPSKVHERKAQISFQQGAESIAIELVQNKAPNLQESAKRLALGILQMFPGSKYTSTSQTGVNIGKSVGGMGYPALPLDLAKEMAKKIVNEADELKQASGKEKRLNLIEQMMDGTVNFLKGKGKAS